MKLLATAALLVALWVAVLASPGSGSCMEGFPSMSEPLKTFAETGEASQDLKCYMRCVMQDRGKMSSNGTITMLLPPARMPEALAKAVAPCFDMTPMSDLCETAYLHNKCLWDNDPERKFLNLFH